MSEVSIIERPAGFPWWAVMIQGVFSLVIGILLLVYPGATTLVIVQFIGIYWLISGIFSLVAIFMDKTMWGWKLLSSVLGILAGVSIIQHPLWSAILVPTIIVTFLGIDGLIIGIVGLISAFKGGGWAPGIFGGLSLLFGFALLGSPFIAALSLPWVYGVLGIAGGISAIFIAFRQRAEAAV